MLDSTRKLKSKGIANMTYKTDTSRATSDAIQQGIIYLWHLAICAVRLGRSLVFIASNSEVG